MKFIDFSPESVVSVGEWNWQGMNVWDSVNLINLQ